MIPQELRWNILKFPLNIKFNVSLETLLKPLEDSLEYKV